jgi:hypothetical protein
MIRVAALLVVFAAVATAEEFQNADVYARIETDGIVLGNAVVERSWSKASFVTDSLEDRRAVPPRVWTAETADFGLSLDGIELPSSALGVTGVTVTEPDRGGLRIEMRLEPLGVAAPIGLVVTRAVEAYPGIAGFRSETAVTSPLPLVVSGYWLDELQPAAPVSAEAHSFRAGADWREPGWPGPALAIPDAQPGTWRDSDAGGPGQPVARTAQWMSLGAADGGRAFFVLERNDYASSWMAYDGTRARAVVDLSRDVVYIGPFEEEGHLGNPTPGPARHRVVLPGVPLRLEPVFTGFGTSSDDEPWQHFRYLEGHRMPPYRREIVFNTNGVDSNARSTGAKDDVDFDEFVKRQLPAAKALGVETFVFDDGWQARSGDWCPDSDECPEPRWDGSPDSRFRPRFPDATFEAVRGALGEMNLGLWMTPMHFNPSAEAFTTNPQTACLPVSLGLVALNLADPDTGSNDAGIGTWNPEAIRTDGTKLVDYIESRIRVAIEDWGVTYFKFDFLVWLDCFGAETVDAYAYRESFLAMLDRLIADHPGVTFEIDETNDYRLFPFESVARGPSWYQNGSPPPNEALHASWILAPFVPPFALGRSVFGNGRWMEFDVDYLMAAALPSHMTFFIDLENIPEQVVTKARVWTDYYKEHRDSLATFTYPLLEDPVTGANWTALQPWNPETGRGFLLVYRQDSPDAMKTVALRNVPPGKTFELFEAPADVPLGTFSSADLASGIPISIDERKRAKVIRIESVSP